MLNKIKGGETASRECPNCHSKRNWKDGTREIKNREVQRYICRYCGYRFSENSYKGTWTNANRQLCAIKKAKKLDTATETKTVAGESSTTELEIKGKLI